MTRALIMAGGADEKWTNLGGEGRRHFQTICGERVIDRLVRQLRERGIEDIGIITPDLDDEDYDGIDGTFRVEADYTAWGHEGLNGQAYWSDSDRTLMVYGDTVFADPAMDVVTGYAPRRFMMFGRFGNGVIKGGGGELFAFSFWPEHRESWAAAVRESFRLRDAGVIKRGGSWEGYRIMAGAKGPVVGKHRHYRGVFTNLNDKMTDDFDNPAQYRKLRALFERIDNRTALVVPSSQNE